MQTRPLQLSETPSALSREGYNTCAQDYLQWTLSMPSPRLDWLNKLFEILGNSSLSTTQVLELGCGAGVPATVKLAQTVGHVIATDISSTQLALARQHANDAGLPISSNDDSQKGRVTFIESDMLELAFEPGRFDAIVAFYCVIQLVQDDQVSMMRRAYEWLKPGGCFLFNVTAAADGGTVMENWLGMKAFWAGLGPERTLNVLRDIGFEVVERETIDVEGDAAFTWIIAQKPNSETRAPDSETTSRQARLSRLES